MPLEGPEPRIKAPQCRLRLLLCSDSGQNKACEGSPEECRLLPPTMAQISEEQAAGKNKLQAKSKNPFVSTT